MSDETQHAVVGRRQTRASVLENAKAAGLVVGTIIDVGFSLGTEGLYGVFEKAHNLLIEPIAEMEGAMQAFCADRPNSSYVLAAASDTDGAAQIVARRAAGVSGFHSTTKAGDADLRTVPVARLDTLLRDRGCEAPFLLKVDTEGHELHVLRGAVETLKATDLVILEVHAWNDSHKRGVSSMMDLFRFMEDAGFAFYDFIEPVYRPLDGALWGFDGVWVKADGPLRQARSYRSKEAGDAVRAQRVEKGKAFFS